MNKQSLPHCFLIPAIFWSMKPAVYASNVFINQSRCFQSHQLYHGWVSDVKPNIHTDPLSPSFRITPDLLFSFPKDLRFLSVRLFTFTSAAAKRAEAKSAWAKNKNADFKQRTTCASDSPHLGLWGLGQREPDLPLEARMTELRLPYFLHITEENSCWKRQLCLEKLEGNRDIQYPNPNQGSQGPLFARPE